jgi:hypothetical protein
MLPADSKRRDAIFATITPVRMNSDRQSIIKIGNVYGRFAQMDVRSVIRSVLQKEDNIESIVKNIDKYNDLLFSETQKVFQKNGVPLVVQNVTISNVKQDATVWASENAKKAALAQVETINKVGEAMRNNPQYLQFKQLETYKEIASKIGSFTIIQGNPGGVVVGGTK